jgi:excisionase family DNA binding protein
MEEINELLTVREVAKYTNLHPYTVRKLAREGKMPGCQKLGGTWLFSKKELDDYIRWGRR